MTATATGAAGGGHCLEGQTGGRGASISAGIPVNAGEILVIGVGGPGTDCHLRQQSGPGGVGGGGAGGTISNLRFESAAGGGGVTYVSSLVPSPAFPSLVLVAAVRPAPKGAAAGEEEEAPATRPPA